MSENEKITLQNLALEDFRGLKSLKINFSGKNTVIFGPNGSGKTSVLDGIALLFSSSMMKAVGCGICSPPPVFPHDFYSETDHLAISGQFQFGEGEKTECWLGYRKEKNSAERSAGVFPDRYSAEDSELPAFAYYKTNRAVLSIPSSVNRNFKKPSSYEDSFGAVDFDLFFEWFRNQSNIEEQERERRKDSGYEDTALKAACAAIYAAMPEISQLGVVKDPFKICAIKEGRLLLLEQFSDSEKCTLAMFGDIARRLSLSNPTLPNPLLGSGIVLIDMVELHLHPSVQRRIVGVLRETFPNVQFIMTTHSPQILGELYDGFKIISLEKHSGDWVSYEIRPGYYDSNFVLESYMGTSRIDPLVDDLERILLRLAANGDVEQAKSEIEKLSILTSGTSLVLPEARMLLRQREG